MKGFLLCLTLLCFVHAGVVELQAQTTTFSYRGRLNVNGAPANGSYDLKYSLYDSSNGPGLIAGPYTNLGVAITNGMFTANLDFGAYSFPGADRWLEVAVRSNNVPGYIALPRQLIMPTPYAITAGGVANGGAVLTNLNAAGLASGTVPTARLGSGSPASSTFLRGDQTWASLTPNDVAGLDTNSLVRRDDSRVLTFSNGLSQLTVSNLWATNMIWTSPVSNSGSLAYVNGALYFNYPQTLRNYVFLNRAHGGGLDGSEIQWQYNLMYMGPVDGGHLQIGLGPQQRVVMYMQYAQPDSGGELYKGQSHQFGFRYGYQKPPDYTGYEILQWNINATNYDNVNGHSKLIIWSPILHSSPDTALGTNMFYWDTHGWTSLQSQHKFYAQDNAIGTNYIVDCLRDVHSITLHTNANITLANLILTNESQRIDLFLYAGPAIWNLTFPSTNWIWESESGSGVAPPYVRPMTMMHLTLFATGGATTNIVASYKTAPYAQAPGLADFNVTAAGEVSASVSGVDSTAKEADDIASLKRRLERLERLLGGDPIGHAP